MKKNLNENRILSGYSREYSDEEIQSITDFFNSKEGTKILLLFGLCLFIANIKLLFKRS